MTHDNTGGKKLRELFKLESRCSIPYRYFHKRHLAYEEMEINDNLIHFQEVTDQPCPNCDRLERDLNHSAYLSDKRAFERDSAERINERVFKENDFLKKQLEICKEYLIKIQSENKKTDTCFTMQDKYWRDQEIKSRMYAAECLAKLDGAE